MPAIPEKEVEIEVEQIQKPPILKAEKPLIQKREKSKFNIFDALQEEKQVEASVVVVSQKDAARNHFSETDLQTEWALFLESLKISDILAYNAINGFKLTKKDEDEIEVSYPSESAKIEFNSVRDTFFNHFKHKVNNFHISLVFNMDKKLKKEILTKRKIFDKFAEINPVLNDLNDLMKFDFS